MTYRLRRQLISTKFKINKSLCKLFIEPWAEYQKGFWVWNVGFAVGKSERQLNDWYRRRKNKNFDMLLVTKSGDLNSALCFTNITAAKTIEKQIKKFDPDFPEIKIINVAQLYNKVFQ